jgi:hypothetical protein
LRDDDGVVGSYRSGRAATGEGEVYLVEEFEAEAGEELGGAIAGVEGDRVPEEF